MTEKRLSFTKKRKLRTYDKLVLARVPFKKSVQIKVMFDTHHIMIKAVLPKKNPKILETCLYLSFSVAPYPHFWFYEGD